MGTSVATVQIHEKIAIVFPWLTHTALSLRWRFTSDTLRPPVASSITIDVLLHTLCT